MDEDKPLAPDQTRVLACGTFDLLHPGHESFLQQAAELGDQLFVVVARDQNVERLKGRTPSQVETIREAAVQALAVVHEARLGLPGSDFLRVVRQIAPDVIALGYDQRAPKDLADAFPDCRIVTLDAHEPQRYKTSLLRKQDS
ncbi:MAG: adenylyltransferase/cytidyltransferase family protein [Gemmatimonadetes bacterium]|jgi:FAD synthetase|nr:adenylyltransferase/cytidyltransferase family protein [Gemmatimonadota bacterium]MBT6144954.1 adenylyltransferase/cytidyltransferase family protein [Gemmatimonadota bacterium]MBT7863383.1 adenylyltransferase/cytidyltransferase family protein [Gemmatimonadota bacterium]